MTNQCFGMSKFCITLWGFESICCWDANPKAYANALRHTDPNVTLVSTLKDTEVSTHIDTEVSLHPSTSGLHTAEYPLGHPVCSSHGSCFNSRAIISS